MSPADRRGEALPFSLICVADFGAATEVAATIRVEAGGFQSLIDRLRPRLELRTPDLLSGVSRALSWTLTIRSMRDFDPASILESFPASARLYAWRRLLAESVRTGAGVPALIEAFLDLWPDVIDAPHDGASAPSDGATAAAGIESVLDQLTLPGDDAAGATAESSSSVPPGPSTDREAAAGPGEIRHRVRSLFGLSAIPWEKRLKLALVAVDQAMARQLEAVLHDAVLRDREAAWRSLFTIVEEADLRRGDLRLSVLHAPRARAAAALAAMRETRGPDNVAGPDLVILDHTVGTDPGSPALLAEAAACTAAGAAVVLALDPVVLGAGARRDRARAGPLDAAALASAAALTGAVDDCRLVLTCNRFLYRSPYVSGETTDALQGWREDVTVPAGPYAHAGWIAGRAAAASVRGSGAVAARALKEPRVAPLPLRPVGAADDPEHALSLEFLLSVEEARRLAAAGLAPLVCQADEPAATLLGFAPAPSAGEAGRDVAPGRDDAWRYSSGQVPSPGGLTSRLSVRFPATDSGSGPGKKPRESP